VYSRLRFIQCASLIFFGIVIAAGVPPLLITAVQQPRIAGSGSSDGPAVPAVEVPPVAESASEQRAERRDDNAVTPELPQQAETKPAEQAPTVPPAALAIDDGAKGATAETSSSTEAAPAKPPTETPQAAAPAPELAQQDETKGLRQGATGSSVPLAAPTSDEAPKATTGSISSRPESAPKPPEQTQEPTAPSPELTQKGDIKGHDQATAASAAADEQGHGARTPMATRARMSAAKNKKAAHPDRSAKRSTNEDSKSVRRPANGLKDIPVSAYAADGTQRRIVIRPTSVQDVYYYSRRGSAPPSGADGPR
jgi:hypothetical protein